MADSNENEFDEAEWQASGKGGPTFRFEDATGEPDFEPGDASRERPGSSEHKRSWRDAEPPRDRSSEARHSSGARRPGQRDAEEYQWAAAAHGAGAVGLLLSAGAIGWLAPLIIWLVRKERGGFAADQAKEALNFQITAVILFLLTAPLLCILLPLVFVIPLLAFVTSSIGAVRTWNGEEYKYPINFRIF